MGIVLLVYFIAVALSIVLFSSKDLLKSCFMNFSLISYPDNVCFLPSKTRNTLQYDITYDLAVRLIGIDRTVSNIKLAEANGTVDD